MQSVPLAAATAPFFTGASAVQLSVEATHRPLLMITHGMEKEGQTHQYRCGIL
jgi:hypothetical protein